MTHNARPYYVTVDAENVMLEFRGIFNRPNRRRVKHHCCNIVEMLRVILMLERKLEKESSKRNRERVRGEGGM